MEEVIKDIVLGEFPDYVKRKQLKTPLTRRVSIVIKDVDESAGVQATQTTLDPAEEFLRNIDRIAVDTGITDLADQHDHYLYGLPKHNV